MPRRPRVVIPGVPHHITQRGNNRQPVFFSPDDRLFYLDLLSRHARRSGVHILGYCLMTNHVHLIAVPERDASLARALRHAHSEYSLALNRSARRSGHVWQNRYFSCPMSADRLLSALRYVELNPVRAGMVGAAWNWRWSSARAHTVAGASDGCYAATGPSTSGSGTTTSGGRSWRPVRPTRSAKRCGARRKRASRWDRGSS